MKQSPVRRLIFAVIPCFLVLSAMAQDHPDVGAGSNHESTAPSFSKKELKSHGLRFESGKRPMCRIEGPDGPCEVEAFVFGETNKDEAAHTCAKLDRSTYAGHCVRGKLEGLSLVKADGSTKNQKQTFLSYFVEGRMTYPSVTSFLDGNLNLGAQDIKCKIANIEAPSCGYGCVYFGKWDRSAERCALFSKIYGADFFSEGNAQKLRDGTFDLDRYRVKFSEFMSQK